MKMNKNILFIGGNGNISWYCVQKALGMGHTVWCLNRGMTARTRPAIQPEVKQIHCDIREPAAVRAALPPMQFDCICDFICMNGEQARERLALFRDRTRRYVVISSDSVYSRRKNALPFTETAEQYSLSEVSGYIAGKIEVERVFTDAYEKDGFPVVIVRPHMVYSALLQTPVGRNDFTQAKLVLEGKPLLMLGDGNNLVAPMHAEDFASAFTPLIDAPSVVGEAFQIANEVTMTWNQCMEQFLRALSPAEPRICHIPLDAIERWDIFKEKELVRQQAGDNVFDCSKIRTVVPSWKPTIPYREGIARTLRWLREDPRRIRVDGEYESKLRLLYEAYCHET